MFKEQRRIPQGEDNSKHWCEAGLLHSLPCNYCHINGSVDSHAHKDEPLQSRPPHSYPQTHISQKYLIGTSTNKTYTDLFLS